MKSFWRRKKKPRTTVSKIEVLGVKLQRGSILIFTPGKTLEIPSNRISVKIDPRERSRVPVLYEETDLDETLGEKKKS